LRQAQRGQPLSTCGDAAKRREWRVEKRCQVLPGDMDNHSGLMLLDERNIVIAGTRYDATAKK
jgi:hypothetical protein